MRLLLPFLLLAAVSASEVPLGHKDFHPSPERPVGFRGDGNGHFPGADPVTRFSEGTATREMVVTLGKKGRGDGKKRKLWAFSDATPINLCWKTELPGWGNAMPIVVGRRVFTLCDPHTLVCVDAQSGEILWQKANNPFELDGLPAAQAESLQELLFMARAAYVQTRLVTPGRWGTAPFEDTRSPEGKAAITQAIANLERMQAGAQAIESSLASAFAATITELRGWMETDVGKEADPPNHFPKAVAKAYQIPVSNQWSSMTGFTMPVPISDGRHVFATIGQGQAVCYDLDGKRCWGRLFKGIEHLRVQHVVSPLLVGEVFIGQFHDKLRGLDKASGRTVWEAEVRANGYNAGSHKHLRLSDGQKEVDVVVTTTGAVIRAADGKILAQLPFSHGKEGGGPSVLGQGDVIVFEKYRGAEGAGKSLGGYWRGRLVLKGEQVELVDVRPLEGREKKPGGPPASPILASGMLIDGAVVWDLETGKALWQAKNKSGLSDIDWASGVMVGGRRVLLSSDGSDNGYARDRADGLTVMNFSFFDLSSPGEVQELSTGNVLGGLNKPRYPELEQYAASLVEAPSYSNYSLPPQFGCYNSGSIFPQGNRLFIRSVSHLYCLGDPMVPFDGRATP